jgi:tRNA1(Val) A37 N6-methylase TrmN6
VVSNPPYRQVVSGRQNPCGEEAAARHEIAVDLVGVLQAAAVSLRTKGRAAIVYPASRCAALLAGMRSVRLEPKRLQIVYSYPGCGGKILLVEAVKNGGEELEVLPPFYVYTRKNGGYTAEMARLYAPDA